MSVPSYLQADFDLHTIWCPSLGGVSTLSQLASLPIGHGWTITSLTATSLRIRKDFPSYSAVAVISAVPSGNTAGGLLIQPQTIDEVNVGNAFTIFNSGAIWLTVSDSSIRIFCLGSINTAGVSRMAYIGELGSFPYPDLPKPVFVGSAIQNPGSAAVVNGVPGTAYIMAMSQGYGSVLASGKTSNLVLLSYPSIVSSNTQWIGTLDLCLGAVPRTDGLYPLPLGSDPTVDGYGLFQSLFSASIGVYNVPAMPLTERFYD